jgi:KaiC/GvpD/RAD55 family RecA-like ATPase
LPTAQRVPVEADARVATGTPELDTMLNGGLMARRPYLVVGPAGTGKTTLALQFLCEGVRRGEETLVVTLEEPPNEMRFNHRNLLPDLDRVWVFDAIPDVMRYERAPFKDVAQVRDAVRFSDVSSGIRQSPELASVEVTLTALEQTLKMQRARRPYRRLVIDSLTALQYFCMKGIDEVQGAQSFLRFLSDLGVTVLLTVESPLEDIETPERMLARGEIRLFRWDLEGRTIRAVGVEKFRGSSHDIRLHPYRIGRQGMDIDLEETISRDTRRILHPAIDAGVEEHVAPIVVTVAAPSGMIGPGDPVVALLDGVAKEIDTLKAARLDLGAIRGSLEAAHRSLIAGEAAAAHAAVGEVRALVHQMSLGHWNARKRRDAIPGEFGPPPASPPEMPEATLPRPELERIINHLAGAVASVPRELAPTMDDASSEPPAPPAAIESSSAPPVVVPSPPIVASPEPSPRAVPPESELPGPSGAPRTAAATESGRSPSAPLDRSAEREPPSSGGTVSSVVPPSGLRPHYAAPAPVPTGGGPASPAGSLGAPPSTGIPSGGSFPPPLTTTVPSRSNPRTEAPAAEASGSRGGSGPAVAASSTIPDPRPAEPDRPGSTGSPATHPTGIAFGPTFESLAPAPSKPPPVERERASPPPAGPAPTPPPAVAPPPSLGPAPGPEEPTPSAVVPSTSPEPPRRRRRAAPGTPRRRRSEPAPGAPAPAGPAPPPEVPGSANVPSPPTGEAGATAAPRRRAPRKRKVVPAPSGAPAAVEGGGATEAPASEAEPRGETAGGTMAPTGSPETRSETP